MPQTRPARSVLLTVAAVCLAILALAVLPVRQVFSQQMREVLVRNFPQTQQVRGNIRIKHPIPHTRTEAITEVVSPVRRDETVHLIDGGTVEAEGFASVTLSLYGFMKSGIFQPGDIGVLLIPDEAFFKRALDESGEILVPIELSAAVEHERDGYFAAQASFPVGFSRYRVLLYNSSDKSAESHVRFYWSH